MTRPATLPELLAQGKVKPGDWVETQDSERVQITERHVEHIHCGDWCGYKLVGPVSPVKREEPERFTGSPISGDDLVDLTCLADFGGSPVKPAKAKKWEHWIETTDGATLADFMRDETGMQVKRTQDGSLMIRYRKRKAIGK